jgi:Tfp pilus assembly protein PilF
LARTLTAAGNAALAQGRRGTALAYLLRSLGHDPSQRRSWKWLAKILLVPSRKPIRSRTCGDEGST